MKPRESAVIEAELKVLNHEWMHSAGFLTICPEGPACSYADNDCGATDEDHARGICETGLCGKKVKP